MKRLFAMRQLASIAAAGILAATGTVVSLVAASPANADLPAASGWYMLVNDYYDGGSGHDDGKWWCLSTNADTSPSGSGTHKVYLAVCNPGTAAQWWHYAYNAASATTKLINYQDFGGNVWELSANASTPSGGDAGTYGAYTAQTSTAEGHVWRPYDYTGNNQNRLINELTDNELSASHTNPYPGGVFRVYTAAWTVTPAPAHLWRFWQPAGRPSCSPCGGV